MSVGKEELFVIESYAKRQRQIYPDAADHGYVFRDEADKATLRQALRDLMEFAMFKVQIESLGRGIEHRKTEIFLAFEIDEGLLCGAKVEVNFFNNPNDRSLNDTWRTYGLTCPHGDQPRKGVEYADIGLSHFRLPWDAASKRKYAAEGYKNVN